MSELITVSGKELLPGDVVVIGMPLRPVRMVLSVDPVGHTAFWLWLKYFYVYETLVWNEEYNVIRSSQ